MVPFGASFVAAWPAAALAASPAWVEQAAWLAAPVHIEATAWVAELSQAPPTV